ncbi:MAG: NADH:ubiquinone reductase (Na(+)-transporting) subunit B [Gemmatimonadota bacterium]|jgi:Na+-transporting NADH:ubiquinone oxidoreductase subunit B|nr:NADH:ubiquinone reductase (Na(+)-transporting) subunit B [Gemmatimonadota bacterium]MDP6529330.1 NADH:ubiquinone reductase (Na(+)-transporting) subunit B [Gemmatimonadota bacterium]MDP6803646.1 NADH:ubiquinone reductase (Na(+)-transporting) subunit B [Gemmatimonadota bacterium]
MGSGRGLYGRIDAMRPHFEQGGRFAKLYPVFEAAESFLFVQGKTTRGRVHVRDAMDIKRLMSMVVVAVLPAMVVGAYNVGFQALSALGQTTGLWDCLVLGAWKMLPIVLVSYAAGGFWEVLFAVVRRHEINEGFLVTGILFPLTCPPTLPLWMVAVGISFGVVIGKEVFGGTGMNILNPALTARAFVFFAYPAFISGDKVWKAVNPAKDQLVDTFTGATPLAVAAAAKAETVAIALGDAGYSFRSLLTGLVPGSMGETSAAAIGLGALVLVVTGVASWRIMVGCVAGGLGAGLLMNAVAGPASSGVMALPAHWHLVMGGFAFGTVFMATDPVSAAATGTGKWIYGFLVGFLAILVRVVNPAYPEGMMLAILFMNIFAPLVDHFVVQANIRRRLTRA